MPYKKEYSDHANMLLLIQAAQDDDADMREKAKEAKLFQLGNHWDEYANGKLTDRYRGTFDLLTPIVDGISGEIQKSDFTARVSPSGGDSDKDRAKILDGLIRNIRNVSNAEDTFCRAARSMVICGFDAWEVEQAYIDGDAFDQDLFIRHVPNAIDSVWFDTSSTLQDRSDAHWGIKQVSLISSEYMSRWPEGSKLSLGSSDYCTDTSVLDAKDTIVVGKLYYRKPRKIELVRMTDGSVYRDDEKFKTVVDELAQSGITIEKDEAGNEKRRTRDSWRVYSRMLDGGGWLSEEVETVFDYIPLIPIYGNFDIVDNVTRFSGKIESLMDAQRVYNYATSRDIEDGALSPAATVWLTDAMSEGNDYEEMNTDRAPIRIYNTDPQNPGLVPQFTGGPQPSVGLQTTMQNMAQQISAGANTFEAQQGNANAQQSGIAGLQQIEQGNIANMKWFKSLEVSITHTCKLLVNALPRVKDGTASSRLMKEDGSTEMVMLNQPTFDEKTQKNVILNDLSIGEYDVVCEVGPAFSSSQKEAVRSFETVASIDPSVLQSGMDIYLNSKKEPGMDLMAERYRVNLFNAGQIPESQWTDEEKEQVQAQQEQAQQQEPQPDPMMIAAQAEMAKAQAEQLNAQNKQMEIQGNQQIKMQELSLREQEIQLDIQKFQREKDDKYNVEAAKIDQGQQKIDLQEQKQQMDTMLKRMELQQKESNAEFDRRMSALGMVQQKSVTLPEGDME